MKAFYHMLVTLLLLACCVTVSFAISISSPVNFNNDQLGLYTKDDFKKDWGMNPNSSSGQGSRLYIVNVDNKNVLQVTYLANQIQGNSAMTFTPSIGGEYSHLFFQYKVKFRSDFSWVKGGKLPGLTTADSPTGCIDNSTFDGFSSRMMWREYGQGFSYIYNPTKIERCGDYFVFKPEPYYFNKGQWYTLTQEVFLNTPSKSDGYIKQWVDGKLVVNIENIELRRESSVFIDHIKMDTFFGGSTEDWAPITNQYSYFDDFIISESMPSIALQH